MTGNPHPLLVPGGSLARTFNRRSFLGVAGGLAATTVLAACGSDGGSGGQSSTGGGSPTGGTSGSSAGGTSAGASGSPSGTAGSGASRPTADLTVWTTTRFTPNGDAAVPKAAADYAKKFGGSVTVQGFPPNDLLDKITTAVSGGGGPDVIIFDISQIAPLAAANLVTDITSKFDSLKDLYYPGDTAGANFQGKQYAVPYDTNNVALFWNKQMFAKAGIDSAPTTWDDLLAAAKELTGGDQYGYMLGAKGYGSFLFWPWLWQNGGTILSDDNTKATFNDAAGAEAWQFYADLYLKHNVVPPSFLSVSNSWDQFTAPFIQEKVAMMPIGAWGIQPVQDGNPKLEFDIAPLPKNKAAGTVIGGDGIAITTTSKSPDAAWAFIEWMTAAEQEPVIESYDLLPSRKDAVESEWVTKSPFNTVFAKQGAAGVARPAVANWSDIEWGVMADAWDSVIQKSASPADALNKAAEQTNAKLAGS